MAATGTERTAAWRRRGPWVALLAAMGVVLVVTGIGVATNDDRAEPGRATPTSAPSPEPATVVAAHARDAVCTCTCT